MTEQLATPQQEEQDIVFYFEWDNRTGYSYASLGLQEELERLRVESQKAINVATSVIRSMSTRMARTIGEMEEKTRPDEVEIEFGLKLDLEAGTGNIMPYVAKTTAGGQFNIRFKWNVERPRQASVLVSKPQ